MALDPITGVDDGAPTEGGATQTNGVQSVNDTLASVGAASAMGGDTAIGGATSSAATETPVENKEQTASTASVEQRLADEPAKPVEAKENPALDTSTSDAPLPEAPKVETQELVAKPGSTLSEQTLGAVGDAWDIMTNGKETTSLATQELGEQTKGNDLAAQAKGRENAEQNVGMETNAAQANASERSAANLLPKMEGQESSLAQVAAQSIGTGQEQAAGLGA